MICLHGEATIECVPATDPALLVGGARVVAAACEATGFPTGYTPDAAYERTLARQDAADAVFVAIASCRGCGFGGIVGHGLVTACRDFTTWLRVSPADRDALSDSGLTAELEALASEGRLLELGALAVAPGWTGRGVAAALFDTRTVHVRSRGAAGLSSVFTASEGSMRLSSRTGGLLGVAADGSLHQFWFRPPSPGRG